MHYYLLFIALIDCFKHFDLNGDGKIGADELPDALSFVGVHPTDEDVADLLRLFDPLGTYVCVQFVMSQIYRSQGVWLYDSKSASLFLVS